MTSAAVTRAAPLSLVRAVPVWAWLTALVAVSAAVHYSVARRLVAPWIVGDELIYSELARSFAESGSFAIRDVPVGLAFGAVYPVLISPAYALFDSLPAAYAAAKAINAVLISLAAVPAYLLARGMLPSGLSLLAAALTVSVPGMLYAGTIMTENAFYPLFLVIALALVRALERPSPGRVVALLGVTGLAFLTRAQAVAVIPAIVTAPLILVALQRRSVRSGLAYRWLVALPVGAVAAALLVQGIRGRSPLGLFGAHRAAGEESYDFRAAAEWLLWHVGELDLALGVIPFGAFLLVVGLARKLDREAQLFLAAASSLSAWLLVEVAVFASRHALRIEERNMFYVAPLFFIALLVWIDRGLPRPRALTAVAATTADVLPAFVPFERLIGVPAVSDTFGLMLWWDVHEWGVSLDRLWIVALAASAVAALVAVACPTRLALGLVAFVLLFLIASTQPVERRMRTASTGALFEGITRERDWVDRAVDGDGSVAAIWSGRLDPFSVIQNEFFSRSVGPVYALESPLPGGLPQTPLTRDLATGRLRDPSGDVVRPRYALVDDSIPLAGVVEARDRRKRLRVMRIDGALRETIHLEGTYDDGWAAPRVTYTRYRCRGGALVVTMESDPSLFRRPQSVTARVAGRVAARTFIPRIGIGRMRVPLAGRSGRCVVHFSITPSAVPGPKDRRRLGTHFRRFRYVAPRR